MAAQRYSPPGQSPFSFGSSSTDVPGKTTSVADGMGMGKDPFGVKAPGQSQAPSMGADSLFGPPSKREEDPGVAYGYSKSLFGHKDEVSVYTAQMDARHAMDKRLRAILIAAILTLVFIPLFTVLPKGLFGTGVTAPTIAHIVESFSSNVTGMVNWLTGGPVTTGISIVFWQVAAIAFVGAALATNGCVFQGALKNPLASPSTLGVMSGATLGTLIYALAFGVPQTAEVFTVIQASELREQLSQMDPLTYIFATQGRALLSMVGSFIVVGLILLVAHIAGRGKVSKVGLLIAGQVFAALITGVIAIIRSYLMLYGTEEQQQALMAVVGGDISSITGLMSFCALVIPVVVGLVVIMIMRFRLNLLAFGDEEAKAMGISTAFTRNTMIFVCTALTGVVVSFVGNVGFVGFLVPHMARKVVGPDFRYLIPASALFGSTFLLVSYYFMQLTGAFSGSIGTLTSLVGAAFFFVVVIRERARGNADWV